MTARAQAQCTPTCSRFRSMLSPQNEAAIEPGICEAFPSGIPADIWEGHFDHRKVHPDQTGTTTWAARADGVRFPTYALRVPETPPLVAAAAGDDIQTGAMIALVPSPEDAQRLAIPGGEPAEDLHLTLLYLGEASQFDGVWREQLISWVTNDLAPTWDYVEADGFAPAWFNPTGEEPCLVMACSGGDLAEIYESVLAEVTETVADLPQQHAPWIPHVTLAYQAVPPGTLLDMDDMQQAINATGPISFDRLRLAFAGEVFDIPLGSAQATTPSLPQPAAIEATPSDTSIAVAAGSGFTREVWDGPLR